MTRCWVWMGVALVACGRGSGTKAPSSGEPAGSSVGQVRSVASFAGIEDDEERAVALFGAMAEVFLHPRCANCHPTDDRPRQGMEQVVHDPPVWRGPEDRGVPGNHCETCHQEANSPVSRVPGAHSWHLAPVEMGWIGKGPAAICAQIKDPARNGGRSLEALHEHLAEDALVAWGWSPGHGREPAPGTQARLGELTRAWIDAGAHCPKEER